MGARNISVKRIYKGADEAETVKEHNSYYKDIKSNTVILNYLE